MKKVFWILVLMALAGCMSEPEITLEDLSRKETSLGDITPFFEAISGAESVTVYEGLPHPLWESKLHDSELKRPDLIRIEGYSFYAKPLNLSAEENQKLTEISLRKDAHLVHGGFKQCGGYHPDYVIIWEKRGKKSGSLICFGCYEWKNFTPQGRLYEDLGESAYKDLQALLTKYVVNRPNAGP